MKSSMLISIVISLLFLLTQPSSSSAHFFPNIPSISTSSIQNNTSPWNAFLKLKDCQMGQNVVGLAKIKQYFHRFGYINHNTSLVINFNDTFDDSLHWAVKTYQQNFKLNTTGQLDATTLEHIIRPRCGNPDIINGSTRMKSISNNNNQNSHFHAVQHFTFFPGNPRWVDRTELAYAFLDNELDNRVRQVIANAFQRWSTITVMNFRETALDSNPDITIGFFAGDHNDRFPFDGPLGVLAHSFAPQDGRFHLDAAETWVVNGIFTGAPSTAVDMESVAVHEIGHLLGLGHSSEEDAIMYPSIGTRVRKVQFAADDIQGIQQLYGSNPNFKG